MNGIIITSIICATVVICCVVAAWGKTKKEPRLKHTECHLDEYGNIESWSHEYE